jgi:hypothetical protein
MTLSLPRMHTRFSHTHFQVAGFLDITKIENRHPKKGEKSSDQATIKQIAERKTIYLHVLNNENINHAYSQEPKSSNHQANLPHYTQNGM